MWAVGVMTYALLSGTLPFQDTNEFRLFRKIRNEAVQFHDPAHWEFISENAKVRRGAAYQWY
jgi:protein serine kinase H